MSEWQTYHRTEATPEVRLRAYQILKAVDKLVVSGQPFSSGSPRTNSCTSRYLRLYATSQIFRISRTSKWNFAIANRIRVNLAE